MSPGRIWPGLSYRGVIQPGFSNYEVFCFVGKKCHTETENAIEMLVTL